MEVNNLEALRGKLEAGTLCLGMVVWLADPVVSEIAGDVGFDFSWIDGEHGALNIETIQAHVMAARGTGMAPIVRAPSSDPVAIKPILDMAPAGVIVPMVNSADDARRAVAACRYPPEGARGCGVRRGTRYGVEALGDYLERSKSDPMIIVQIESAEAVANLDEILAVPGYDSICVGPSDLAASMGMLGAADNSEVEDTIDAICEKATAAGVMIGSIGSVGNVDQWKERGVNWLAVGGDVGAIFLTGRRIIGSIRGDGTKQSQRTTY